MFQVDRCALERRFSSSDCLSDPFTNSIQSFGRSISHSFRKSGVSPPPAETGTNLTTASIPPVQFKAESERALRFQLVSFVGDEAEKVNAAVFRAATGPVRDALKKLTQE